MYSEKASMPSTSEIKKPDLEVTVNLIEGELSRYWNGLNELEALVDKLRLPDEPTPPESQIPDGIDYLTKLSSQIAQFNRSNRKLESILEILRKVL